MPEKAQEIGSEIERCKNSPKLLKTLKIGPGSRIMAQDRLKSSKYALKTPK